MSQAMPARDEMCRLFVEYNARQPNPLPVCPGCGMPFQAGDAFELDGRLCASCGVDRIETLMRDLVRAADRPATLRALEAITRFAM